MRKLGKTKPVMWSEAPESKIHDEDVGRKHEEQWYG